MLTSALLVGGGTAVGGPGGGIIGNMVASGWSAHGEAELEQAEAYEQLVAGGMSPREAYAKTYKEVYLPNLALLFASDFITHFPKWCNYESRVILKASIMTLCSGPISVTSFP
jgi:hypothetical protein